jgi:capsular exopolysaccharide synthesis family protein
MLRRWIPLFIVAVTTAAVAGYFLSSIQPKQYEAKATLIVGTSLSGANPDYNQLLVSQRLSSTYAAIATTHDVMAEVIQKLGLEDTPELLVKRVSVTTSEDTSLLEVTARDTDPTRAAAIANALAERLIAASPAVRGQQAELLASVENDLKAISADIASTQAKIDELLANSSRTPAEETTLQTLQSRVVSLRATSATLLSYASSQSSNLLTVVQPALAPATPIPSRAQLNAVLAATLAVLLLAAVVFVIEYLDDALKDPAAVEDALGLPTLGSIERMAGGKDRLPRYRLATLLYPRSVAAEAYRALRTNVDFASVDEPIRRLLITSAVPGEGKTVTAANLAVAFAQSGRRVLLVDADLRRPGVHDTFGLNNEVGLTTLLRQDDVRADAIIRPVEEKNLEILTAGPQPANPAELLASQRMKSLVSTLSKDHDIVIFDGPPLEPFTDSAVLSSFLDGTILVVEARRGRLAAIRGAREALAMANARVLGVVLNGLPRRTPSEYGRYIHATAEHTTGARAPGPGAAAEAGSAKPR